MNKLIDRIQYVLEKDPRTRDNDDLLCSVIWFTEAEMKNNPEMAALEFLSEYSKGRFTPAESIRRCRQKLQEHYPIYRGVNYGKRKERAKNWKSLFKK
jgi:hypothetical protein